MDGKLAARKCRASDRTLVKNNLRCYSSRRATPAVFVPDDESGLIDGTCVRGAHASSEKAARRCRQPIVSPGARRRATGVIGHNLVDSLIYKQSLMKFLVFINNALQPSARAPVCRHRESRSTSRPRSHPPASPPLSYPSIFLLTPRCRRFRAYHHPTSFIALAFNRPLLALSLPPFFFLFLSLSTIRVPRMREYVTHCIYVRSPIDRANVRVSIVSFIRIIIILYCRGKNRGLKCTILIVIIDSLGPELVLACVLKLRFRRVVKADSSSVASRIHDEKHERHDTRYVGTEKSPQSARDGVGGRRGKPRE